MTFQLIFQLTVCVSLIVNQCGSITLNCSSSKPKDQASLSCTCTNPTKNGVEWNKGSVLVTNCVGTSDSCFPLVTGYTSDVTKDEFYMEINPYSHVDCATYKCKDTTTGDEDLFTTSIADFDNGTITAAEPGANMDGSINITTDCVFAPSDLTIKWYKFEDGEEKEINADSVDERSTCTRMCGSVEDKKVTSGFTHQEYNGSNPIEVEYMVTVSHSSYTQQFVWTSAKYHLKGKDCVCDCECKCKVLVIVCAVFGGSGVICLICDIIATLKKLLKNKVLLVLIRIAAVVLFIISIGLGAAALGNDDCNPDCCCPDKNCCCSDWVGNGATAFVVISSLGVLGAVIISFLICVDAIGPGQNEEGGPDGPDGGHNGGGALMTHARVHAGHEETHRGSLSNRPMPAIPTHQGQDKKGRGLSANFDDDHPMVSISVPEKKAGDLGPLHEEPQKKRKKKKKRTDEE